MARTIRQPEQLTKNGDNASRKGGAPEVLTRELAIKIVEFVELMPDSGLPVTWESIVTHVNKRFGTSLRRDVLSTKEWEGRKLIREAKDLASATQARLVNEKAPKYANSSRAKLRQRIVELEARNFALTEQLNAARKVQVNALDVFRVTNRDLRKLADAAGVEDQQ